MGTKNIHDTFTHHTIPHYVSEFFISTATCIGHSQNMYFCTCDSAVYCTGSCATVPGRVPGTVPGYTVRGNGTRYISTTGSATIALPVESSPHIIWLLVVLYNWYGYLVLYISMVVLVFLCGFNQSTKQQNVIIKASCRPAKYVQQNHQSTDVLNVTPSTAHWHALKLTSRAHRKHLVVAILPPRPHSLPPPPTRTSFKIANDDVITL